MNFQERRKTDWSVLGTPFHSPILKNIEQEFQTFFQHALTLYSKYHHASEDHQHSFIVRSYLFPDELILSISLITDQQLSAMTTYASMDRIEDSPLDPLIEASQIGLKTLWSSLLNAEYPEKIQKLAQESLFEISELPFEWKELKFNKMKVFLKVDNSHPLLEEITEKWLQENDSKYH